MDGEEPIAIYEVIRQRYERGSIIVTPNRALEEWHPLFLDELMASAGMDRLMHHAHVVVIEGHSYRNPPGARKAGQASALRPRDVLFASWPPTSRRVRVDPLD